jgi:hypothetical protein
MNRVGENRPQQAFRVTRIEQRITGHQSDEYHEPVYNGKQIFQQWPFSLKHEDKKVCEKMGKARIGFPQTEGP